MGSVGVAGILYWSAWVECATSADPHVECLSCCIITALFHSVITCSYTQSCLFWSHSVVLGFGCWLCCVYSKSLLSCWSAQDSQIRIKCSKILDTNYFRHLNKYKLYKWQACHAYQDAREVSLLDFQPLLNVNGTERSTFLRVKRFLQVSFILVILRGNHKLMAYLGYMQRICVTVLGFSILMNAKQQEWLWLWFWGEKWYRQVISQVTVSTAPSAF